MAGRWFDQWQVGDRLAHEIRRTVTETDNLLFSTMTHNPQPLHIDAEAAKASEFGQILVNGTFTFAADGGAQRDGHDTWHAHRQPRLRQAGSSEAVFIGDTLRAESEVVELRESRSRPDAGIVTFRHVLLNQRDEIVCQCLRSALLRRHTAGQ